MLGRLKKCQTLSQVWRRGDNRIFLLFNVCNKIVLAWENIFDDFVSLPPLFVLCRATAPAGDKCCAARQREKRDGRRFIPGQRSRVEEGEQPLKEKDKEEKQETVESNSGRQEFKEEEFFA
jgi:hypothetical protein